MRLIALLLAMAMVALSLSTVCADQSFRIVRNDGNQAFLFNFTNQPELVRNPNLKVAIGEKLTFRIESIMTTQDPINNEIKTYAFGITDSYVGKPIDVSSPSKGGLVASSGCARDGFSYHTTNLSNPCEVTWTVVEPPFDITETNWYYVSNQNFIMIGLINITSTKPPSTQAPPAGITTSPPTTNITGKPTTTPPPTKAPTKNTAAVIVPGAAAIAIIAAINALFA